MSTAPAMNITPPYTPELLESVSKFILGFIDSIKITEERAPKILEFGSGWSTIWFAQNGCDIVSVEHDIGWYTEVATRIDRLNLSIDCKVFFYINKSYLSLLSTIPVGEFDLVLVDGRDEDRIDSANLGMKLMSKKGILILDDTHWDLWKPLITSPMFNYFMMQIAQYQGEHIRKNGEKKFHHTTVYIKR